MPLRTCRSIKSTHNNSSRDYTYTPKERERGRRDRTDDSRGGKPISKPDHAIQPSPPDQGPSPQRRTATGQGRVGQGGKFPSGHAAPETRVRPCVAGAPQPPHETDCTTGSQSQLNQLHRTPPPDGRAVSGLKPPPSGERHPHRIWTLARRRQLSRVTSPLPTPKAAQRKRVPDP